MAIRMLEDGRFEWEVPADLPVLNGHFPGNPIVPGVAILDVTLEAIASATGGTAPTLRQVKSAKFLSPVTPGMRVLIQVHRGSTTGEITEWQAQWREPVMSDRLLAELSIRT